MCRTHLAAGNDEAFDLLGGMSNRLEVSRGVQRGQLVSIAMSSNRFDDNRTSLLSNRNASLLCSYRLASTLADMSNGTTVTL